MSNTHPGSTLLVQSKAIEASGIAISLALQHGVSFIFDEDFQDTTIALDLSLEDAGLTLEQALERLAYAAGHLHKQLDETTYLVAEDTPQSWRDLEDLVIRLFRVENVPVKTVDHMLRSLIEARRLSTSQVQNIVVLRDTADKVEIAARLIDLIDRPQSELDVGVEVLAGDPGLFGKALRRLSQEPGSSALHLTPEQLDQVRRETGAKTCAATRLGVVGSDHATYGTWAADASVELDVKGTAHPSSDEFTLTFSVQAERSTGSDITAAEGDTAARREVRSTVRLQSGSVALLTGLGFADRGIAVALTPLVVRTAAYTEADLEAVPVGTESRMSAEGLKQAQ